MSKLLQVLVCGLAAASFSAFAADNGSTEKSTGSKANSAGNAGVGASTSADIKKTDKKKNKKATKHNNAGAGSTKPGSSTSGSASVDTKTK